MVNVTSPDGIHFYQDNFLNEQIEKKIKPKVQSKDQDQVFIVDGGEGVGKSLFAMQLAKSLDSTFNVERVCFTPVEFTKAVINANKGEAIIFDEAFTGLSSRGSLTEVNTLLVSLMMEMRQKNSICIIVMPTFFLLDKYVALWRAKGLFHVYMRRGKRGYWMYFNRQKKKLLYLHGKKLYDYSWPRSGFKGRFYDQYTIDKEEYLKRKSDSLMKKQRITRSEIYMAQRDTLFYILTKEFKQTQQKIVDLCKKYYFDLDRSSISVIIKNKEKQFQDIELRRGVDKPKSEVNLKKLTKKRDL